jgi:cold shock CspA family protein
VEKGRIIKYYGKKKYGFIKRMRGKDIFFHVSDVTNYHRGLKLEGKEVAYDSYETRRGKKAFNVIII